MLSFCHGSIQPEVHITFAVFVYFAGDVDLTGKCWTYRLISRNVHVQSRFGNSLDA